MHARLAARDRRQRGEILVGEVRERGCHCVPGG
jgi:hypothetical protein